MFRVCLELVHQRKVYQIGSCLYMRYFTGLFWHKATSISMTERQTQMLNLFLDGYEAKITSKTWSTLAKCSKDTAIRDIQDLVAQNILVEDIPGAKRPSYSIVYDAEDLSQFFSEVQYKEDK